VNAPRYFEEDVAQELTPVVPSFKSASSHAVPHELLESLERYKLVARLGHGGMAEVFLAAWEVAPFVHRPVVIKRLHTHFTEDQRLVQMFVDEARLLCVLEHPHVVKTLEAGVIDGRCCIAMEYLEGQPLHRVLRRAYQHGKLPIEVAVGIAISVLSGLSYAHDATDANGQSLEIVHRDISPQNVFVTNDGQVKVLDFGIAKAKMHEGRTATGVVKGKVGYIAPEQAKGEQVDRRADVWSTGVLLWEALTGTRLFKGETDAATLNASLQGEIPSPSDYRPELPVELDMMLDHALQRSPTLRYRSASALQGDLEEWLRESGASAEPEALGGLMQELFAAEILEQRRLVTVLMARSDCTAPIPSSARAPSSTSALIVTSNASTSTELSSMNERMDDLSKRHRRAVRSVWAALGLLVAAASVIGYFAFKDRDVAQPTTAAALQTAGDGQRAQPRDTSWGVRPQPKVSDEEPLRIEETRSSTSRPVHASLAQAKHALTSTSAVVAPGAAPIAITDPASFGFLTIDTSPWSQVSVGGKVLGQTPLVNVKLPAGNQVLTLHNGDQGIDTSYTVSIESGKTTVRRIGIE
jgi:serine/threonine-protein kinase